MKDKIQVLKGYDDLIEGKKSGKFAMILIVFFSLVISVISLTYALFVSLDAVDKVKVITNNGKYLDADTKRKEDVLNASIQEHLANTLYFLNSFDRNSIENNQIKALYLVDKNSADRIFDSYSKSGAYNDAVRRGIIYKTDFLQVTALQGNSEPYTFEVEGVLNVVQGSSIQKNKIVGKGKIIYNTPSFPNNVQGFQVIDYLQDFYPIQEEN